MKLKLHRHNNIYVVSNPPDNWQQDTIFIDIEEDGNERLLEPGYEYTTKHTKLMSGRIFSKKKTKHKKKIFIELQKRDNEYIVTNMPGDLPENILIELQKPKSLEKDHKLSPDMSSYWKDLLKEYPDNEFIKIKAENFVPYTDSYSDKELLFDALKQKYDL
jgi:hypothetical protein